ncbi:intradiol ring-cleavage dioxygenase [Rhizobium sp. B230/85]|uniref:intradiol ring-cleavage dioxygenase n=1 Tax=unclassified Rhizobium TaxID=2613769 RepID=UPI001ADC42A6|nr:MULTISPECIES: intradiol ring-cleavage dioxygenase [unclassified Rhizobium]MBO9134680.1 intradiol ring-cleavage dioxygenase [Rhizobium sp. B209b/85]MBO9170639.1 intradiol ring-cleavage dioxygenase [Rhizobium sp. L245/93]QXZ98366.1 intradiol ring-cleavage dioxygenase [Rhizobium sp. B230/85]
MIDQQTKHDAESGYFSEESSVEVVLARMAGKTDPRLREVMSAAIRHLHAFVKEVEPNQQEWGMAIDFLTETGQICNEWRQEFILLSDILGVSMLVDAINNRKPSGATETTVLGPFHVMDAPQYENGANICLDGKGEPLLVQGRVTDTDGKPIAGAMLDVWQANDEGFYDVQQKGLQPEMNLRGIFKTDADGSYWFKSVRPKFYPIPDDGPVGKLLGQMGRHPFRPAHIHFIVGAAGFEPITTHIFTPDCPYLHSDAVFGVKEDLIADFGKLDDPKRAAELGFDNPFEAVTCDFVLVTPQQKLEA